ncbi:MFS transporter [Denitromonas iodatirespirans]|uniref:MFS transporter n=1 Tax=Denitromonas iodatirespirans TaxID=2795389 RepID=A0A944D6B7_DENI1|nr:MFS transporter [Denitromonas iodatirespirans]MBT0960795.1 MFS transporter [Denitromonas iodatirespirans]
MLPYWRLSGYYFFYFAFIGAFSPYFTLYLQSLAFSAADIAILMSLMQVMRILAPNLWGWLADRLGARMPIVRVSALASLAGFAVFFQTTSFAGIFVGMAVMAFFWSAALPLIEGLTFAHLAGQPGRYGKIRLWGSVGFIVAVLGIGHALTWLPVDSQLAMTAALLAGIVVFALCVPEAPRPPHHHDTPGLSAVLRRREVKALLCGAFFMSAAHGALYVFYSILLVDAGYSKALVGWMWTLGVVAEIGVFMLMPRLTRRFGLRRILLAAFVAAVLRFAMIGWGVSSLEVLVLAQLLHGATFGAYHAAAIAAVNRWFPGRLQSRGQALYGSLSFGAGGMLGGLISGYTWDWIGAAWTFTLGSVFGLIGLIWVWRGWRTDGFQETEHA